MVLLPLLLIITIICIIPETIGIGQFQIFQDFPGLVSLVLSYHHPHGQGIEQIRGNVLALDEISDAFRVQYGFDENPIAGIMRFYNRHKFTESVFHEK